MNNSKNGKWIIPFKKLIRLWVNDLFSLKQKDFKCD